MFEAGSAGRKGFAVRAVTAPAAAYMSERQVHQVAHCAYQCSVTAVRSFITTRTPLTSWFWAIYRMSHDKKGISAMQLCKEIGVGYRTAWTMQHKSVRRWRTAIRATS